MSTLRISGVAALWHREPQTGFLCLKHELFGTQSFIMPMMSSLLSRSLVVSLLCLLPFSAAQARLEAKPIHSSTLVEIADTLKLGHYNRINLDDALSGRIFEQYLKDVDPAKSYLLQSDIDEFEVYRTTFDDQIKAGDLSGAYLIYNRFQSRLEERLTAIIALLESDQSFDFTVAESLNNDREKAPWAKTQSELDQLWHRRVKSALLNLKLAGKTDEEARELVLKRYKNQQQRAEQIKSEDVFQTFANAFTEQFDPHTQYFSPRSSENFQINMSLSLEGIGAVLKSENEFTQIVRLVPAGPADKTGQLKASDMIVGVGQGDEGEFEDVVGWRLDDVVDLIRGPKDTVVRLQVKSPERENAPVRVVRIVRNKVKLEEQSAQKRVLELNHFGRDFRLGVIEIPAFYIDFAALQKGDANYKSTSRDVEKLINELKTENIDGLIIDLRNNGGGSLREANETVGLFINRGPTVQVKDSTGRIEVLGDHDPKLAYDGPMAVLVNRLSASASEIFAGAIQDYNRGIIIGGQTFGKGTVQTLLPLDHGQLKLTNAKFYRISGDSTQNRGVHPDISFPTLYDPEIIGESALDQALDWDTVRSAPHGNYIEISPFITELEARYEERTSKDPDFQFMREQIAHLDELKAEDALVPLQESALKQQRDEMEGWQLEAENRRRAAKQLPLFKSLTELTESLETDAQGKPINPEAEAMLAESGRILIDLMYLTLKYSAASAD
ncbi:carboxy terminal-processing peptidase [Neptuniibacter sp. CAU 1671]|uniref:carboxy terminal-processing peptidase n=1 Tax=Neptuniibacter sp. CAU 1671 TaxID=3032593 RepID=UPI0023DAE139|nr:carboxy terminal-processing peptidase [Neptuniibacter sp. CAU 1671]MDF2182035.1 carboxy terminal-processing peptidase [Neptuniibacter sp. CAU 1671]